MQYGNRLLQFRKIYYTSLQRIDKSYSRIQPPALMPSNLYAWYFQLFLRILRAEGVNVRSKVTELLGTQYDSLNIYGHRYWRNDCVLLINDHVYQPHQPMIVTQHTCNNHIIYAILNLEGYDCTIMLNININVVWGSSV